MKILIVYPHGNALNTSSGGNTRVYNLAKSMIEKKDIKVSILHSSKSIGSEDIYLKKKCKVYYYKEIELFGISDWYMTDFNPSYFLKLHKILRNEVFDFIQIEFPWGFFSLKLLLHKYSFLIYDALGVESEFIKISIKNQKFPKFLKPLGRIYAFLYEYFVSNISNYIITVSERDRNFFIDRYNISKNKIYTIPISSSLNTINQSISLKLKFERRKKLNLPLNKTIAIFHGSYLHPANQEAFNLIIDNIAPQFKNEDLMIVLAGYKLNKFKRENVISIGFVEELTDLLYSADFAIIPIISGSGMRVKCADYISVGLPFVTTQKGKEGIEFLKNNQNCIISETVDQNFLNGIKKLLKIKKLRDQFRENLLNQSYKLSFEYLSKSYIKFLMNLKN